ncbi:YmdB family metallophosphoesterase [Candidatus Uhrbacteria bacterium]|nr:YmdB family metallophosphoesterase [Candidatus Uhrbacteria bacterium]
MGLKILFFGDVVGAIGRNALASVLPGLKDRLAPDLVIANAENLSHGAGVTEKTLLELSAAGVDLFTGGNHSWNNPLGVPLFDDPAWADLLIVPTNYGDAKNGRNWIIRRVGDTDVLIANLMGRLFTHPDTRSPFTSLDLLLTQQRIRDTKVRIVDFHAEATAEKEAFGHFADGRVSAVFGTHTHVATADAKILPGGTAYITDIGRCGAEDSVIGYEKKTAIKAFLDEGSRGYDLPKTGRAELNAVLATIDAETGKTLALDRIREFVAV